MAPDKLYFEDNAAGQKFTGDTITLDRDLTLPIASRFDDQGMHTDS